MHTKKIIGAGLLSIGAIILGAQTTFAYTSPMTLNRQGNVTFNTEWPIEPPGETVPPTTVVPPEEPGAGDSDLSLIYALNFRFGTQTYTGLDAKYNAVPRSWDLNGGGTFTSPLGASVGNSDNVAQWSLSLEAQNFISQDGQNTVMDSGMQMQLNDVVAENVSGDSATAAITTAQLIPGNAVTLGSLTSSTTRSINKFSFGSAASVANNTYTGVQLDIPAGLNIKNTSYQARVVWTLKDTL
ncbi:WxL domain-containing protein [Enterococcus ureasiticus]|uniref:WxL domain-containing protein n=1 Tax=Enterococcus ureasiticus TaxID=903984 RepID=A0A1E5GNK3_9ENTE|nr:WxL domain-containing protein [Enterococcus ureasiticus]OEG14284.1 hypothetical protein BCR21_04645 [Enterococcus ureasiticus]